jgi:hypothetical protein
MYIFSTNLPSLLSSILFVFLFKREGGKSSRVKEVKVPWITVLDEEECNHVDDIVISKKVTSVTGSI